MTVPVRKCAGCGKKTGKPDLARVVRLPSREVQFDPNQILQGRSLYFCSRKICFEALMRRGAPEKLLKKNIPVDVRNEIISYLSQAESGK